MSSRMLGSPIMGTGASRKAFSRSDLDAGLIVVMLLVNSFRAKSVLARSIRTPNPKTPICPTYVGIGTLELRWSMVDNDLGNLPHHGEIRQPRTMAAMEIFGRISRRHYTKPLNKVIDESGLAGFGKKLRIRSEIGRAHV